MSNLDPNSLATEATLLLTSILTVMAGVMITPSLPAIQEHSAEMNNASFWTRLVLMLPALFIVIGSPS